MELFHEVPDAQAIMISRGVYRQAHVYHRGERVYVKYGSGFVRLLAHGDTSCPSVRWEDMDEHVEVSRDGGMFDAPKWHPRRV